MPTGGVELEADKIRAWFAAGVKAVGMGSKLITRQLLEQQDYTRIQQAAEQVLQTIQTIKR
jgi:2-dehydro-3-deoxyphosphogluconate aldolase/(4S)-4-hydroxy-2-oxoglutarate aldolase